MSTNRKPGIKVSSAGKEKEIKRPALKLFLKCLEIETNQIGLEEIKEDLLQRLQAVFHTKRNIAELLLAKLDHALRGWTTSGRIGLTGRYSRSLFSPITRSRFPDSKQI